jgi:hypothetical protein
MSVQASAANREAFATDHAAATDDSIGELSFAVDGAAMQEFAAVPMLRFGVGITADGGREIRSIALNVQLRIAPGKRGYDDATRARLIEVFGRREQWSTTMRTLLWAQTTLMVPGFTGSTHTDLLVPCTYDFDVVATKLLNGIRDGTIPLEFLFSGTVFYLGDSGQLRTSRIGWDRDANYDLPVTVWRDTMAHYFPRSAWLRLSRDAYDKLYEYKSSHSLVTWDDAVSSLIGAADAVED